MRKKLLVGILIILVSGIALADFYPYGNIIMNDQNITGANVINATIYYGNASQLTGITSTSANSSEYWDDLNTFNSTQMENSGGYLNILVSWLEGLFISDTDESNLNVNSSEYWDTYDSPSDLNYLILSYWQNITARPTHLGNFTDNLGNRGYTSNLNFTNDAGYYNATDFSIGNYSTTAEIIAFGYYNASDFVITDYFTKTQIENFGYYNSSDFSISDYYTKAQVLAFNYYNSSDFDINDYVTSAILAGYNYYNSSDFSISDYYTKTQINDFNYYNSSDFDINDYATNVKVDSIGNFSAWDKDYSDLTNKPTNLTNFTDDLGDRGYDSLSNFSDDLGARGYTHLSNFTDNIGVSSDWDELSDLPTATPASGDTTHLSLSGQIYSWVISLAYATTSYVDSLVASVGNWSADKSSYWNTSTDLDTVIATDEITELKIDFNTVCGAGNHLYVNGNNLACEADDDTTYTAGDGITLTGNQFNHTDTSSQASSNNSARTYIQDIILDTYGHITSIVTATETVTNTDTQDLSYDTGTDVISLVDGGSIDITEVDTSANTICSGSTTYLDGEGNCDDISSVYAPVNYGDDWNKTYADTLYSAFGASVDDTEMTAEDFGEFTCTGDEDGCTLDSGTFDDEYIELGDNFVGDVTGTYGATIVGDNSHNHSYTTISVMTEANLYTILSDVTQFYESGDKVGDADTLDTHDTSYFQIDLTDEASLYTALSDVTEFLETNDAGVLTTLNTGQGAYELYAMNQDVESTDNVQFQNVTFDTLLGETDPTNMTITSNSTCWTIHAGSTTFSVCE